MGGKIGVGDAVVALFGKTEDADGEPQAAVSKPDPGAERDELLATLACGHTLHRLGAGDLDLARETRGWRKEGYARIVNARAGDTPGGVFSVRSGDGTCTHVILVSGRSGAVSAVVCPPDRPAPLGSPSETGRVLIGMGISLGAQSQAFAALRDRHGELHFADVLPERLEMSQTACIQSPVPIRMPKAIVSVADLLFMNTAFGRGAHSIGVDGTLWMSECSGVVLPAHLNVGVDLSLQGSDAAALPARFSVGRDLDISHTPVEELPETFHVGRSIIANGSALERLNGGMTVRGDLDLRNCRVKLLPWGLEVAGSLDLSGTRVTSVPPDCRVHGNLMVEEGVEVPPSVFIGGRLLHARDFGYEVVLRERARR